MYQNIKLRHNYVTVVHKYFCCRKILNKLKSQIYDNTRVFISHSISTALSNIGKKLYLKKTLYNILVKFLALYIITLYPSLR